MKRITLLLFCSLFLFGKGNAQCVPDTSIVEWGIYPSSDSLPCIERGVPYSTVLQFKAFDFADADTVLLGIAISVDSIRLDSISNLPPGISYQVGKRTYLSNEVGCLDLFGVTPAPVGDYTIEVHVTLYIPSFGASSQTMSSLYNNGTLSLGGNNITPRFVRVINLGAPCVASAPPRNLISGSVFYDANNNGIFDSIDVVMANQHVNVSPQALISYTNTSGEYNAIVDSGSFVVSYSPSSVYALTTASSYPVVFTGAGQIASGNDFGLYPVTLIDDVMVTITSTQARPGFQTTHWINYQNIGTTIMSGTVTYTHNPVLSLVTSTVPPTSQSGNVMTWDYVNLYPGQQKTIQLTMQIPPDNNLRGDTLRAFVNITPDEISPIEFNNNDTTAQVVSGSYDPNDKLVLPGEKFEIAPDQRLTYTIRFQNTGTDTAFTVVIRDTIDTDLDISTFKTIATSHPASLQIEGGKYAIWTFNNILLPDSGVNEPASHGFVRFSVLPIESVADQAFIFNSASIYFDFNDPVKTNTTVVKVDFASGMNDFEAQTPSRAFPNPSSALFTIALNRRLENFDVSVYDVVGNQLTMQQNNSGEQLELNLSGYPEGIYFFRVSKNNQLISTGKLVVVR